MHSSGDDARIFNILYLSDLTEEDEPERAALFGRVVLRTRVSQIQENPQAKSTVQSLGCLLFSVTESIGCYSPASMFVLRLIKYCGLYMC